VQRKEGHQFLVALVLEETNHAIADAAHNPNNRIAVGALIQVKNAKPDNFAIRNA
jgi:hypothetical protein